MAFNVSAKGGSDRTPVPAGVHVARCVTVVDCGLQETTWQGQVKYRHKVWVAFEVPGVRVQWTDKDNVEKEGPALIGQMYTASISDRAILGQHLVNWRGRAFTPEEQDSFDLFTILDKPCQLSITHKTGSNGKVYDNITGIMGLPSGMQAPDRETDLLRYSPEDSESQAMLDKLPGWLQEKVRIGHRLDQPAAESQPSDEPVAKYQPSDTPPPSSIDFDDDIPF